MEQKVIKIGNSLGVIIPKEILDKLGLKAGSAITIEKSQHDNSLVLRDTNEPYVASGFSSEFHSAVERVHKKYSKALKELANK